jgi:hypothetical protein
MGNNSASPMTLTAGRPDFFYVTHSLPPNPDKPGLNIDD